MKTAENLPYLFQRFVDHECTPEELQQLFVHFGTADEMVLRFLISREIEQEELAEMVPDPERLGRLFDSITGQIETKKRRGNNLLPAIKIAATVIASFMLLGGYVLLKSKTKTNPVAAVIPGKLREIHLPDGSTAMLDAGTILTYPAHFTGQTRTVTLTHGAAFFDVVHQIHQPFIVKTNTAIITVMGTSFEVAAFGKDKKTRVSVKTGLVGVQIMNNKKPARLLTPGQTTVVTRTSPILTVVTEQIADIAAWREQKLIFNDQPLSEVMESLERKYNVRIEIQNEELLNERISMRLNNQPLQDILSALSFANHFNYVINDQLIVVK